MRANHSRNRRRLDELEARAAKINLPKDRTEQLQVEWVRTLSWEELLDLEGALIHWIDPNGASVYGNAEILARYQDRFQAWCDGAGGETDGQSRALTLPDLIPGIGGDTGE